MDVLLVEDEPLVRASAAEALRDAGLDVAEAASAEEALAAPRTAPPTGRRACSWPTSTSAPAWTA